MGRRVRKKDQTKESTKEKLKLIKKEKKKKLKEKRARLIIRNLPFNASEEQLREHFEKFGELEDVKILKKEDGKLVGCGFVQFKAVQKAAKARHHLDGKPFLDRNVTVEFALAKNKFAKSQEVIAIKQEDEIEIKEEPNADEIQEKIDDIKDENPNNDESNDEIEEENDEKDSDDSETNEESEEDEQEEPVEKKSKFQSNDVVEGRTIFIKNVPFSATNEDLKECIKQYGPIYYALICTDKYTEHSKGTAFVKFVNVEDAEKALNAGTELTLFGNVLDCHKALGRNELQHQSSVKESENTVKKDSRNLYLVKEGVILAGTKAAEGVSATDMAKRLQLEQYKTQMLKNLNMFISPERLVVHNLPPSWDDKKFRSLIENNSLKNAIIREARIMRDLKNLDSSGVGRSKEFGFVKFVRHEDALSTLRTLNNNPNIFSSHKRPVVTFSIENRSVIRTKEKRLEKSRLKNPKCKDFNPEVVKMDEKKKRERVDSENVEDNRKYVGVQAKQGKQKFRSRHNLKNQFKIHNEQLKREKKKNTAIKSLEKRKQDWTKQPKQKINKKKNTDDFAKLVANYRKKLVKGAPKGKNKWYEES